MSASSSEVQGMVSMRVGSQLFGVHVLEVRDVINQTTIDLVSLAPSEVAGLLNLRGRIVTAVDMRRRPGLPPRGEDEAFMCVIVEHAGELYALLAPVGEVVGGVYAMITALRTTGLWHTDALNAHIGALTLFASKPGPNEAETRRILERLASLRTFIGVPP